MTWWRFIFLLACLELAGLVYFRPVWHATQPAPIAGGLPSTPELTPFIPEPAMATEMVCQHWQYPEGPAPVQTRMICVNRQVRSPF